MIVLLTADGSHLLVTIAVVVAFGTLDAEYIVVASVVCFSLASQTAGKRIYRPLGGNVNEQFKVRHY